MPKRNRFAGSIALGKIESRIYHIRNKRVMLDRDLAELYGVKTQVLNQAVRRNMERFPEDFMFQMTKEETKNWISQIVLSNKEKMGLRKYPYAFTEEGVAMLSGVLHSKMAIHVHIQIIRTFTRTREAIVTYKDLLAKINQMEKKYDDQFQVVFKAIKLLIDKSKGGPDNRLELV